MINIHLLNVKELPDPKECPEVMLGLPKDRTDKILRYRQLKDRKQSLGAGILLEKCLNKWGFKSTDVYYGSNGKPQLEGIHFNLSHSHDMVVCAVSNRQVGCDIERIDEWREGVAERYFTEDEVKYLHTFAGTSKTEEFYRLWTLKESYLKMTGEGISLSLDRIEFKFGENVQVYRDGKLCACSIKEYEVPGYKLSVCVEEFITNTEQ